MSNQINLTNFHNRIKNYETITKDSFTLDIDSLNWNIIIYNYAKLFAYFLNSPNDFKKELKEYNLFRPYYSSSKTGIHIKCIISNNVMENLFYRALFRDDIHRFRLDFLRLNREDFSFCYDVAFKCKSQKGILFHKEFKLLNILELANMKKTTFYKLIDSIKKCDKLRTDLILNSHKDKSQNYKSLFGEIKRTNDFEFTDEIISQLDKILLKYKTISDDDKNYSTKYPESLARAIYKFALKKRDEPKSIIDDVI